jgi:hypothetical protein
MPKAAATKKTESPAPPKRSSARKVPFEEIQNRAFFLFLERGGNEGRELDDWFQAERELSRSTRTAQKRAA